MLVNPVNLATSFGKTLYLNSAEIGGKEALWEEAKKAEDARRRAGADVPVIGHAKLINSNMQVEYEVEGDYADINTNPLTKKHLDNLFKNFFALDKAGILHGDLSMEHLYFAENGKVEIDGFRSSTNFNIFNKNTNLPSNAREFEESGLHQYVSKMNTERQQTEFLKEYLQAKSDYHIQRAEYLLNTVGLSEDNDAIKSEIAKAKVFSKPSKGILDFELAKLNLFATSENALDFWKDGCGKIDGIKKPNKKTNSILLLFDCLKCGMQLRDIAESTAHVITDTYEAQYFESEKEYLDEINAQLFETVKTGAQKILNKKSKGFKLVDKEAQNSKEAIQFDKLYSKINIGQPYYTQKENIDRAYSYLGSCDYKNPDVQSDYAIRYANYA